MSHNHCLGGIGDQVARHQRILHAHVTHGNTVTNCNGGEHNGRTARHGNTKSHRLGDLIQIHMAGNDLVIRADNTDQRSVQLFTGQAQCAVKRTVRRVVGAVYDCIFNHDFFFLF